MNDVMNQCEQLITFDTAKLAKEKGLRIGSLNYYNGNGDLVTINKNYSPDHYHKNSDMQRFRYEAPTQSLLQKWLREKFFIYVRVDTIHKESYYEWVHMFKRKRDGFKEDFIKSYIKEERTNFKTYEEALEKGLQEALKLRIKNYEY